MPDANRVQFGSASRQPYAPPSPSRQRSERSCCVLTLLIGGGALALLSVVAAILIVVYQNQVSTSISTLIGGSGSEVLPTATPTRIDLGGALAVGETARLSQLNITVTDVKNPAEISDLRPPLPNHQFWAIEVTFENTSTRVMRVNPVNARFQDAAGNLYGAYIQALLERRGEESPLREPLEPGETVRATLLYEAPVGIDELFWVYSNAGSAEYAVFRIR